jgi:DNA-binding SARP family transcriptional activator/tetratricopeptide (TPR) repeat protein
LETRSTTSTYAFRVRISVLGPVRASLRAGPVALGGHKQRLLLALLLCAHGRPVSVDRIIDQLWDAAPPGRVMVSLQAYVANLRRALEPDRPPRAPSEVLVTRAPGYALVLPDDAVDARVFEAEAAQGRALLPTEPAQAREVLQQALARWQGPAYGDLPDRSSVVAAEATRLESLRLTAVEDRWAAEVVAGSPAVAAAELEALVDQQPLRESLWVLLVRALYAARGQAEALDAVRRARDLLVSELGLDPGPELRRIEQAVLRQDPSLSVVSGTETSGSDGATAAPVARQPNPHDRGSRLPAQRPAATARTTVVGRAAVMTELEQAVQRVEQGRGQVVVLSGEPGIGKTHLARAVLDGLVPSGWRRGWGSWESGDGTPALWPWGRALRQVVGDLEPAHLRGLLGAAASNLAPLLPGLEADTPERRDSDSATFQTATAVLDLLGHLSRQTGGCALVLDDVQWADADSLRLLRRLASELHRVPTLVVLTCRDSAEAPDDLIAALADLTRADAVRLRLQGLTTPDVATWIAQERATAVDLELAEAVRERTDGNPFYVGELVRLLASEAALTDHDAVRRAQVPDGVKDVVRRRLAQLPATAGPVLEAAAVAGRAFDLDVLEAVVGDAALVESALIDALQHRMVEEDTTPGRYRFVHALVHDAVYAEVPGPRRARLHGDVAAAVERRRVGRVGQHLTELAQHYRLAGRAQARAAWTFAARAAEQSLENGAAVEAARLFTSALDSLADDPVATADERVSLLVRLGRAHHALGRMAESWDALRQAASVLLDRGDAAQAARALLVVTEGAVWTWRPYSVIDHAAVSLWQQVLDALPEDEVATRARVQAALAVELLFDLPATDRRIELAEEALAAVRRQGTEDELLTVLHLAHISMERPDLLYRRRDLAEEMVQRAERSGSPAQLAHAWCKRAADSAEAGDWTAACADVERAYALAVEHQVVAARLIAGWGRVLALQVAGDASAAEHGITEMARLQQSVSMPGEELPLIHVTSLRMLQGRPNELEDVLRAGMTAQPGLRDLLALTLAQSGRLDEAREVVGPWSQQRSLQLDYMWTTLMAARAMVWSYLGDPAAVAELTAALTPYEGRLVSGGMSAAYLGAVDHVLGELALAAGDAQAARRHLSAAVEVHERHHQAPWAARSLARLAEAHRLAGDEAAARSAEAAASARATSSGSALPPPIRPAGRDAETSGAHGRPSLGRAGSTTAR